MGQLLRAAVDILAGLAAVSGAEEIKQRAEDRRRQRPRQANKLCHLQRSFARTTHASSKGQGSLAGMPAHSLPTWARHCVSSARPTTSEALQGPALGLQAELMKATAKASPSARNTSTAPRGRGGGPLAHLQ